MNMELVNTLTHLMVGAGHRIFQVHRFANSEYEHIKRLEKWADFPLNAKVIDMGCGVGHQAKLFNQSRPDLSFCLVNISQVQLDYADQDYPAHCCDFCNIPEEDQSFDAAMFCFSIGHADHAKAIAEAKRLLKPGGVLFIYDMVRVSGSNAAMIDVDYAVYDKEFMVKAARGFALDFYMEPSDSGQYGREILGDGFNTVFQGTIPAIWRFTKC
jgi:ubiquinone/menaquinone biosynthesis C-methylase UbiE